MASQGRHDQSNPIKARGLLRRSFPPCQAEGMARNDSRNSGFSFRHYILKQAYRVFRFYNHRLTLQERPAVLPKDQFVEMRQQIKQLLKLYFG
jgi:hypothetical protein